MIHLIIGNFCSLLAMLADSFSASRKTPRGVLLAQTASQVFYGLGTLALGGYSACVQNVVSIVRNLASVKGYRKKWLEWTLVVVGVVFGVWCNTLGIIGLLPVAANLEYTLAVFRFPDNARALKAAFLINAVMFGVFNAVIQNFVGVIADLVVVVTTAAFLLGGKGKPHAP